jgi:hypothetical protein
LKQLETHLNSELCTADVNLDGLNDLVVTSKVNNNIAILVNEFEDDSIKFNETQRLFSHPCRRIDCEDIDGDGYHEILVLDILNSFINVFQNMNGTFSYLDEIVTHSPAIRYIAWSDFNGDGFTDFATDDIMVYRNLGNFRFVQEYVNTERHYGQVIVTDVDSDGKTDIITSKGIIFYNKGDWNFEPVRDFWEVEGPITAGDLNSDGEDDVLGFKEDEYWTAVIMYGGGGKFTLSYEFIMIFFIIFLSYFIFYLNLGKKWKKKYKDSKKNKRKLTPSSGWNFPRHLSSGLNLFVVFTCVSILVILIYLAYLTIQFDDFFGRPTWVIPVSSFFGMGASTLIPWVYYGEARNYNTHKRKIYRDIKELKPMIEKILNEKLLGYRELVEEKLKKKLDKLENYEKRKKLEDLLSIRFSNKAEYVVEKYEFRIELNFYKAPEKVVDNPKIIMKKVKKKKRMLKLLKKLEKSGVKPEEIKKIQKDMVKDLIDEKTHTRIRITDIDLENYPIVYQIEHEINQRLGV